MKNRDLLYSALIATILALNPLVATPLKASVLTKTNSLSMSVAKTLYNRGLDADAAKKISEDFFAQNEDLFAFMLNNIKNGCSILGEDEIINYISTLALQRKKVNLDSYASLVSMVHQIKNKAPNKETLKELQNIAMKNFLFSQHIKLS